MYNSLFFYRIKYRGENLLKNKNGAGNIYKIKGKRRKLWAVRITVGYSIEGKQIRKYIGTYETKREAQEALFEYLKNPKLYSKKIFKEIREIWWESYKKIIERTSILYTTQDTFLLVC